jgi:hypothetical protein
MGLGGHENPIPVCFLHSATDMLGVLFAGDSDTPIDTTAVVKTQNGKTRYHLKRCDNLRLAPDRMRFGGWLIGAVGFLPDTVPKPVPDRCGTSNGA